MKISRVLDQKRFLTNYATLDTYKGLTTFKTRTEPYYVSPTGWDEIIALKNVEYDISEGVLFVKGTRIYHYSLSRILGDLLTSYGKRSIWKLNDDINNNLVEPFEKEDIVIRKFFFFKKTVKAFNLEKITLEGDNKVKSWYLSKRECPYEVAFSNFKVIE